MVAERWVGGVRYGPAMAAGDPSVLRWAVSLHDELCHALKPTDIDRAVARGYAEALCGHRIPGAALDPLN